MSALAGAFLLGLMCGAMGMAAAVLAVSLLLTEADDETPERRCLCGQRRMIDEAAAVEAARCEREADR